MCIRDSYNTVFRVLCMQNLYFWMMQNSKYGSYLASLYKRKTLRWKNNLKRRNEKKKRKKLTKFKSKYIYTNYVRRSEAASNKKTTHAQIKIYRHNERGSSRYIDYISFSTSVYCCSLFMRMRNICLLSNWNKYKWFPILKPSVWLYNKRYVRAIPFKYTCANYQTPPSRIYFSFKLFLEHKVSKGASNWK